MKGIGYRTFYGSFGSESILVRVQAGRDVVSDVLEDKFLKQLHQNGGKCHRAVIMKIRLDSTYFRGTGMMVAGLKQVGTVSCKREIFNVSYNINNLIGTCL